MSDSPLTSELDRLADLLAEAVALPPTDREILTELRDRLRRRRLRELQTERGHGPRKKRIRSSAAHQTAI